MTTEIEKTQTFEEKLKTRIREGIGDLMTDEDLSKLIQKAAHEIFFQERVVKNGFYDTKTLPPLLHELVKEQMQGRVDKAIKEYIQSHNAEVLKAIETVMQEGIATAVVKGFSSMTNDKFLNFQSEMMSFLRAKGIQ